jgi:inhibitor of KinA sporulation pathway (predicted exonuclease)
MRTRANLTEGMTRLKKRLDQIIAIDVEATCWRRSPPGGQESEIIEIGVCSIDAATGRRLGKESILVRPEHSRVGRFCTALTNLTQAQVDTGVSFADACALLQGKYLTKHRLWVSYGDYDRRMFERQCRVRGIECPFGPTHGNVKNLVAVLHGWKREVGMPMALQRMGLSFEGSLHRGMDDAWNVGGIVCELLRRWRAG